MFFKEIKPGPFKTGYYDFPLIPWLQNSIRFTSICFLVLIEFSILIFLKRRSVIQQSASFFIFIFIFEFFEIFQALNSSPQNYLFNEILLLIISFFPSRVMYQNVCTANFFETKFSIDASS